MVKNVIIGGSGLLGTELQKHLKEFATPSRKELDVTKKVSLPEGAKYVFHLAASLNERDSKLLGINVKGTENVLKACVDAGVRKIIYPSSIGVLGEGFLLPDSPYNPKTPYERSKMLAENLIMKYSEEFGLRYTIVRFPVIVGPNRYWKGIIQAAMNLVPIFGSGKNQFPWSDWRDSARFLSICTKRRTDNKIYHAVFGHKTYEDMYGEILNVLGIEKKPVKIPYFLGMFLAYIYSSLNKNTILLPEHIKRLTSDRVVITNYEETGFKPEYSFLESIRDTINLLFPSVLSDKRDKHTRNV